MLAERKYTSVAGAAQRQGVGKTKIRELISDELLPAYKLGRRTLIALDDLDNCFERNLTPLRPASPMPGEDVGRS